jgi:hypothetical protein
MSTSARQRTVLAVSVVVATLAAGGCGTSEYERRVKEGRELLQVGMIFSAIAPTPSEIPGTPILLRLPTFINASSKAFTEDSADPRGQGKVDPNRVQPPFLKLPGLRVCYEMTGIEEATGEPRYFYCYLAVAPVDQPGADGKPFEESVQAQLAAKFSAQPQWEEVKCPIQSGKTVDWKRITVKGPQPFLNATGAPGSPDLPGTFELYSKDVDGQRVIIGWRFPNSIKEPVADIARLVAGSITSAAAANPPAAAN